MPGADLRSQAKPEPMRTAGNWRAEWSETGKSKHQVSTELIARSISGSAGSRLSLCCVGFTLVSQTRIPQPGNGSTGLPDTAIAPLKGNRSDPRSRGPRGSVRPTSSIEKVLAASARPGTARRFAAPGNFVGKPATTKAINGSNPLLFVTFADVAGPWRRSTCRAPRALTRHS